MRQNPNPFEGILSEDGLAQRPPHPFKDLFKRNGLKLADVAYHVNVSYPNLVAFLGGYGCIGHSARIRLTQFATVIELAEQKQAKRKVKKNRRKGTSEK